MRARSTDVNCAAGSRRHENKNKTTENTVRRRTKHECRRKYQTYSKEKKLTQKELGKLSGINEVQIRQYEIGKANPKIETLAKIAGALEVDLYNLYTGEMGMEEIKNYIVNQTNTYRMPLEVLQNIVRKGEAAERIKVHDSILLTFDGKEEQFEIIGIDAEELVDKNLKHSVTLQAVRLIGEERLFDEDGCNDWSKCSLRTYLQSEEFLSRFTEDMKKYTALVIKKNGRYEDTQDRFFILSKDEICGGYQAFKTERDRSKINMYGETDCYCLRSAYRGYANFVLNVLTSGYVYYSSASYAYRFAPTFVIAH